MSVRHIWWSYVKGIIRQYPELAAAEADIRQQRITPNYTGMPSSHGGTAHGLEDIVARQLPTIQQKELDAVRAAIEKAQRKPDGDLHIQLISLVYWKQSHTLDGAAYKLHIHVQTAKNWNRDFVYSVARAMGLLDGIE